MTNVGQVGGKLNGGLLNSRQGGLLGGEDKDKRGLADGWLAAG